MKTFYKIISGILIAFFLGLILYIISIAFNFGSDICGNDIYETKTAPNKLYKIVVFERNCGATTDFTTQISILNNEDRLKNEKGNIFSADSNHGKAELTKKGTIEIKVGWLTNEKILIQYDKRARIFESENSFNNIKIEYKKL